jgi:hypothetical protein
MLSPLTIAKQAMTDRHVIEEISYSMNYIMCSCGWEGDPSDENAWKMHRREIAKLRPRLR